MRRIISVEQAIKLSKKLRREQKVLILTGGCFDVIHLGHIKFLEAAKKTGDILFVLLESDENVHRIKGDKRPIHNQDERAQVLAGIRFVDYVIKIPFLKENGDYDKLILRLNPSIIAITKGSSALEHSKRQAKQIGAQLIEVIGNIPEKSTTKIAQIILNENKL
ncbi:MAG TPA: adenylyltransferase/cytidyltransferase family protein [Patescibacteria group bacterium]|jgi:rfaE bifunctional protein nucleotidyltransferase chain/domain|nr:adenylyltransferase/cytidyltransferase family protein [Patescibacteria group bacterium]